MIHQKTDGLEYTFRPAKEDDTAAVLTLYKGAVGTPFCVWDEEYPGPEEIGHDLETGNLFVLENSGGIMGAISIAPENELDEQDCWSPWGKAGEFARVVIHPEQQGKGLGKILVQNVLSVMGSRGLEAVHIAVAAGNIPARKTYHGLGFVTVGRDELWGHVYDLCELSLKHIM